MMAIDFSEFKIQDKSSWNEAAKKSLKGKPLDDLKWQVDEHISMDPFQVQTTESSTSLLHDRRDNDWLIGESFDGSDANHLNDQLMKALSFGLDSPLFFDIDDFDSALDKVRIDFLWPVFRGGQLDKYLDWISKNNFDPSKLKGGFIIYETDFDAVDITDALSALKSISQALPQYYHSQLTFAIDPEDLGRSIGRHLILLSELIFQLKTNGLPVKIICELECDNDYVKSISTIRAIRLMVAQICDAYQIPSSSIVLDAYVNQTAIDLQQGMIGASSQAMAAVTAGVDRLTIASEAMNVQEDEEVTRRLTRNVHHLMKMESGLDKIADPLAGSYTIETLTRKIAERSWIIFQQG